jgi:hypothetical protein
MSNFSPASQPTAEDVPSLDFSPNNWAHQALLQMDEAMTLVTWASVSIPDVARYERGRAAFFQVAHLLAQERERLEAEIRARRN